MAGSGDVVIRAEGLGKKYTIKHAQNERYSTLRDSLSHRAAALGRWANPFTLPGQIRRARRHALHEQQRGEEEFWALKDVSFEIRRGERVGIIGRNGAGKSTLLKILSRITEPSTGRVEICGRVASLLEVGTGFHPELTGRENIYLNGAILGMTRREIRSKFDEIVDFAEVEKFLDTPVKRYSSGMYVRLAFAVAAHLEPEILVVDEVLAVGDTLFQKKCLGKLNDVSSGDWRTVLFVSHNLDALSALCEKSLLLNSGTLTAAGNTNDLIMSYQGLREKIRTQYHSDKKKTKGIISAEILSTNHEVAHPQNPNPEGLSNPQSITFRVTTAGATREGTEVGLRIVNSRDQVLLHSSSATCLEHCSSREVFYITVDLRNWRDDEYRVTLSLGVRGIELIDREEDILSFEIDSRAPHLSAASHIRWDGVLSPFTASFR